MESYAMVMCFLLFVFLTGQYLSVVFYFAAPTTSVWQPISDAYIQEDNQSFWCNAHFHSSLYNSATFDIVYGVTIQTELYAYCLFFLSLFVLVYHFSEVLGPAGCLTICYLCLFWSMSLVGSVGYAAAALAGAYLDEGLPASSFTCSPIVQDAMLAPLWSNSEWNSTDAWLEFANVTSLSAAEGIRSWFVAVNISCFVGFTLMLVLLLVDFDPNGEEEEPPDAPVVPIDT